MLGLLVCAAALYALWFTGIIVFAGLAAMPPVAYAVYGVTVTGITVRCVMRESPYEDSLVFFGKLYMRLRGMPFGSDEEAREVVRSALEEERKKPP